MKDAQDIIDLIEKCHVDTCDHRNKINEMICEWLEKQEVTG